MPFPTPLPTAAADGSHAELARVYFLLQALLPRVIDSRLPGLGPSERAGLLGTLGQADLDAHAFESKLRLLVNDALFFEAAA